MKHFLKYYKITLSSFWLIIILITPIISKSQQYTEYELKAAYIFNFGKFVEWPSETFKKSNDPFIIGIYGNNPFSEILQQTIQNKTIQNRPIIILNVTTTEEASTCHILFISKQNKLQLNQLLQAINNKPILTVGDNVENFCQSGGIINFTSQYSQKRFEINYKASARAILIISSKLLALSRIVTDEEIKF
ncbi:MAG: hypothetical protein A2X08_10375 [Bacteroidetes bacterium GWA2_32_17]|nr:MAG: hypothetical protein A2X08_10375 [Bacteroidetes bacterium GWA2_32_17]